MVGNRNGVPGIAGDDPSLRRLILERIEIFRLAGEQADDRAVLEQAARIALAHELDEVRPEGDVEDRVRLGLGDRLRDRAGVDLALRRPLLADPLDVGALGREQLLEHGDGGLAVFVVRRDRRPFLRRQLGRLVGEHRGLLVGARPQAERVAIALGERDRVGKRLGGEEEDLLLLGVVGHREADVGEEGSREHRDAVVRDELVGRGHRVRRLAAVVLADHLELLAVDAAGRVDLVERELPALAIGLGEGGDRRVGVDLADLDRVVGDGGRAQRRTPTARTRLDTIVENILHVRCP